MWRRRPHRESFPRAAAFRFRSSRSSIRGAAFTGRRGEGLRFVLRRGARTQTRPGTRVDRDPFGQRDLASCRSDVASVRGFSHALRDQQRDVQPRRGFRGASRRARFDRGSKGTRSQPVVGADFDLRFRPFFGVLPGVRLHRREMGTAAVGFDRNGLAGMSTSSGHQACITLLITYRGRTFRRAERRVRGRRGHPRW